MSFIKRSSITTLRIRTWSIAPVPASIRHIRIKESSRVKPNGEHHPGPSEKHAVDKRCNERALDPQAQNAQNSMASKPEDRPAYVHGKLYKDGSNGTGGASVGGSEEATAPSWWDAMKQKMETYTTTNEAKRGNRQHDEYVLVNSAIHGSLWKYLGEGIFLYRMQRQKVHVGITNGYLCLLFALLVIGLFGSGVSTSGRPCVRKSIPSAQGLNIDDMDFLGYLWSRRWTILDGCVQSNLSSVFLQL
ncbi:hypothetical protein BU17DRAFT_85373 [Hysterangium stoloniferum]|nr:hypothetical protein BU17DRAFT_85373 [Hysterangium stoloniferum]